MIFPEGIERELKIIGSFAPFVDKEQVSKLLNVFSKLVVNPQYDQMHGLISRYASDLEETIDSKGLKELVSKQSAKARIKLAEAKLQIERGIEGLEGLANYTEQFSEIDWNVIYRKLGRGEPIYKDRMLFFDRLANDDLFSRLTIIDHEEYAGPKEYGGIIYACAMGNAMDYARIGCGDGPKYIKLIPEGEAIFTAIADDLLAGMINKEKARLFTRATRNSLIQGCNYQDAGHFAGNLFDPAYTLSDYSMRHVAKDAEIPTF